MSFTGPDHHIATLRRRAEYLQNKINKKDGSEAALRWHQSEAAALRFALNIMREIGYKTDT